MKVFLVLLLSVVGLATAIFNKFCQDAGVYTVPHPISCKEFIICNGNDGTVQKCPAGRSFDSIYLACIPSSNAKCGLVEAMQIHKTAPAYVPNFCSIMSAVRSVPSEDCSKYYACEGAQVAEFNCPKGQHYSASHSICMAPLAAGCRALENMCLGEHPGYAFPSHTCEDFFTCSDILLPQLQACPRGQHFSFDLQTCTSPTKAGCLNATVLESGLPSNAGPPAKDVIVDEPICAAANTGSFFPHPICSRFYMCYDMVALEFDCEWGQYFNATQLICIDDVNKVCLK